jgi:hypothetical protein
MDPDPAIFVSDLQDVNKKIIYLSFFAYYFLKVHLHYFSKTKSHKTVGINVFLTTIYWLDPDPNVPDEKSRIRIRKSVVRIRSSTT